MKPKHVHEIDIDTGPSPRSTPAQAFPSPEPKNDPQHEETSVYVLEELVQTERTYVHFLNAFLEIFVPYITQHKHIKSADAQLLLRNFPVLASLHRELLAAMEGASLRRVADVFIEFSPRFLVYSHYCSPHEEAMQVWRRQPKDIQAMSQRLVPRVTGGMKLNMSDVFMKPIQRITKYPLFLTQLAKCDTDVAEATRAMQTVLHRINQDRWVHGCQWKAHVFWKRVRPSTDISAALVMGACFEIHHHALHQHQRQTPVRSLGCFLFANRAMVGVKPKKKEDYHLRYVWRLEASLWELSELCHLPVDHYGFRLRRGPQTHVFDFLTLSRDVHLHWLALLYQTLHLRLPTRGRPDQVPHPLPSYHEIQVESFRSPPLAPSLDHVLAAAAEHDPVPAQGPEESPAAPAVSSSSSSVLKLVRASTSLGFYRSEPLRRRHRAPRSIEPYFSDFLTPVPPVSTPPPPLMLLLSRSCTSAPPSPTVSSSPQVRPHSTHVDWLPHAVERSSKEMAHTSSWMVSSAPHDIWPLMPNLLHTPSGPVSSTTCHQHHHHHEGKWSWLPFRHKLDSMHLVQNLPALTLYT